MDGLREAIAAVGGPTKLARLCGVSKQTVFVWTRRLPPGRVLDVSRACGWRVSPHRLAPHLYPNPTDGLPTWLQSARKEAA